MMVFPIDGITKVNECGMCRLTSVPFSCIHFVKPLCYSFDNPNYLSPPPAVV